MNIELKICGITESKSIKTAAEYNIQNLGFASNNLPGPNTCDDNKIKKLIKECKYYKINSVLLTRHKTLKELFRQINFTKPKIISCSYYFSLEDLELIKSTFKKTKIGIATNIIKFDYDYFFSIKDVVDIFYFDLNVYTKNNIITHDLDKCFNQIEYLKKLNLPIYIGGGINSINIKKIVREISPNGLDVSRSLKNKDNSISSSKLRKFQTNLLAA